MEDLDALITARDKDKIEYTIDSSRSQREIAPLIERIREAQREENEELSIIIEQSLRYDAVIFNGEFDFSNCVFKDEAVFDACTFQENVFFRSAVFEKKVSFSECIFHKKVRFHFANFKSVAYFTNTSFNNLVDFYSANFHHEQQFHLTDFLDVTIFSNVIFHQQVQFLYNKTRSTSLISFESAEFKQALDLSRANFWCKMSFWNSKIMHIPTSYQLYVDDSISGRGKISGEALKKLRETYRIIKNEFTKEGNAIEALKYYSFEMAIHEKEMKLTDNQGDRLLLWLNKNSNSFGTKWQTGVWFTIITTFIFYLIFLAVLQVETELRLTGDCSGKAIFQTLRHFVELLNIAKWDLKPFGQQDYNLAYVVLFVARMFIAYGYYQTIQAFRKFGGKSS